MKAANVLFGKNLQRLRKSKGESQDDLAEALETTNVTISRWENGKMGADRESLSRLCKHFKVSPEEFLKSASEPPKPLSGLSDDDIEKLAEAIHKRGQAMARAPGAPLGSKAEVVQKA